MLTTLRKKLARRREAAQFQRALRTAEPRMYAELQAMAHHAR
jgi:hypothetical protein